MCGLLTGVIYFTFFYCDLCVSSRHFNDSGARRKSRSAFCLWGWSERSVSRRRVLITPVICTFIPNPSCIIPWQTAPPSVLLLQTDFLFIYIYIFACVRSHTLLCVERVTETWLSWLINAIYSFRVVFYSSFGVMVSSWCLNYESNSINAAPRPLRPPRPPSADVTCWPLLKSSKKPFLLFLCRIENENENGLVTGLM